jgi:hypothetical protein
VVDLLVDLIGIEPMTSSMPWKRAPSCATGPLVAEMQLFHCLRWGGIRQTPASIGDGARLPWRMRIRRGLLRKEGSADEMVQGTAGSAERLGELSGSGTMTDGPLRGGARRKRRDREHCGGVPVSKRSKGAEPWGIALVPCRAHPMAAWEFLAAVQLALGWVAAIGIGVWLFGFMSRLFG